MRLAPIVLFTYNRPVHTRQTIDALLKNEYASESDLIIFSDAPKNCVAEDGVRQTRAYLRGITGFRSIKLIERAENMGLAANIIDGVTQVVNEYGRIIVLEDDLLTSPYFLKYMNEALSMYEHADEVISVHGYVYPVKKLLPENFFLIHTDSLGWGTWKDKWVYFNPNGEELLRQLTQKRLLRQFNFDGSYDFVKMLRRQIKGENNSWAIRWYASAFLNNKLSLYPGRSLIFHNGSDGSGTNYGGDSALDVELSDRPILLNPLAFHEDSKAKQAFIHYFRYTVLWHKIRYRIKHLLQ
ncbi:glycosyl transferase [Tannerella sp. oral taxon 808]|nr:glycosyl transferase [Tannerella sp. oral taxon 808]